MCSCGEGCGIRYRVWQSEFNHNDWGPQHKSSLPNCCQKSCSYKQKCDFTMNERCERIMRGDCMPVVSVDIPEQAPVSLFLSLISGVSLRRSRETTHSFNREDCFWPLCEFMPVSSGVSRKAVRPFPSCKDETSCVEGTKPWSETEELRLLSFPLDVWLFIRSALLCRVGVIWRGCRRISQFLREILDELDFSLAEKFSPSTCAPQVEFLECVTSRGVDVIHGAPLEVDWHKFVLLFIVPRRGETIRLFGNVKVGINWKPSPL